MALILCYDTETAGLPNDHYPDDHPAQPPLVQLGCLLIDADNGAEWATLELIVKPEGKYKIPDSAAKVHGITTELAETVGVPLSLVVPAFVRLRNLADVIVAYNAPFDLTIMRQAIARLGKPVSLPGPDRVDDVAMMATPLCAMPPTSRMVSAGRGDQFKMPKLVEAHEFFFGERFEGAHGALADARATARIWFEIKRLEGDNR